MNKLNKIAAALALLGSAATPMAYAQTSMLPTKSYNPSWYFAPSINAFNPDDRFGFDGNGKGFGLHLGKAISPSFDIQLGPNFARRSENGARLDTLKLDADALYMFSRGQIRPFLLGGLGVERIKASGPGFSESKTAPFVEAGLGVQFGFTNKLMGQLDFRRTHAFLRNDTPFDTKHANDNYLNLGLGYAFGGPTMAAKAPTPAPIVQMPIIPQPTYTPVPAPAPVVVQAPAPVPTPAPVQKPRVERITMSDTELFDFNKSQLRLPQLKLDEMAAVLASNPQISTVNVNGYTDRLGTDGYNQKLSQARANAVKAYLVSRGVDSNRIRANGLGEANPVVQCNEKDRAALIRCLEPNRRVEIEQITIERTVQ